MTRHASVQEVHIWLNRIDDDVLFLVGGAARAVVEVSGVDFSHQGADEQAALVAGFAAFLNSLTFPVQILVRAVPVDVSQLAGDLEDRLHRLPPALADLGRDHSLFLRRLARERTLLDRHCYVVIPAGEGIHTGHARWSFRRRPGGATPDAVQWQLLDRCEEVSRGLGRCGLTVRRLSSAELLRLFAACWRPVHALSRIPLHELLSTTTTVTQSRSTNERSGSWPR